MLDAASKLSVIYFNLYQGYLITAFLKFTTAVLSKHKINYLFCPKATTFY